MLSHASHVFWPFWGVLPHWLSCMTCLGPWAPAGWPWGWPNRAGWAKQQSNHGYRCPETKVHIRPGNEKKNLHSGQTCTLTHETCISKRNPPNQLQCSYCITVAPITQLWVIMPPCFVEGKLPWFLPGGMLLPWVTRNTTAVWLETRHQLPHIVSRIPMLLLFFLAPTCPSTRLLPFLVTLVMFTGSASLSIVVCL